MTVAIKDTAFAKYLRHLPRKDAADYLFQCLAEGPSEENLAWELWREVHGDNKFPPSQLPDALSAMLDSLGDA